MRLATSICREILEFIRPFRPRRIVMVDRILGCPLEEGIDYVKPSRAGEWVMEGVRQFLEKKLKSKVNPKKSKVDRATRVKFLGFSHYKRNGEMLIRVAGQSLEPFCEKLRHLIQRTRSGKLEDLIQDINLYTMGWIAGVDGDCDN